MNDPEINHNPRFEQNSSKKRQRSPEPSVFREVFGSESTSNAGPSDIDGDTYESAETASHGLFARLCAGQQQWHALASYQHPSIEGLHIFPSILSLGLQTELLNSLLPRFAHHDQIMHFGPPPMFCRNLMQCLKQLPIPPAFLDFNQMIANYYAVGAGIADHVDLQRFEDGIVVVSLGSQCVMQFHQTTTNSIRHCGSQNGRQDGVNTTTHNASCMRQTACTSDHAAEGTDDHEDPHAGTLPQHSSGLHASSRASCAAHASETSSARQHATACDACACETTDGADPPSPMGLAKGAQQQGGAGGSKGVEVVLTGGSVMLMMGDARWRWTHGIVARPVDDVGGVAVPRGERVSLTLRRVRAGGCVLQHAAVDACHC